MKQTFLLAVAVALAASAQAAPSEKARLDEAFNAYWQAENPEQAAAATRPILEIGASFPEVSSRLSAGRVYSKDVATGRIDLTYRTSDRVRHHYRVLVPKDYDPRRRYPVHFYLHGGVARPAWRKGGAWWSGYDRFESSDRISVFPSSWESSMWWQQRQAENLAGILDHLKRTYNLDEDAAHLIGISDGATGAYFFAFRAPTLWASYLPFIRHPAVLANKSLGVDGEIYPRNLLDQPFFVVNGGRDRLYPTARVVPFLDLMQRAGAKITFRPQPEAGHDTSWWPAEAENIKEFISTHRRDPLPDRLAWETERTDRYQRNRWLVVQELGRVAGEANLPAFDHLELPPAVGLRPDSKFKKGVRIAKIEPGSVADESGLAKGDVIVEIQGNAIPDLEQLNVVLGEHGGWDAALPMIVERGGQRTDLTLSFPAKPPESSMPVAFGHDSPSGRIEVIRRENTFHVQTQGIRRYQLLLSSSEIDFARPVTVITNGRESFRGLVEPSVETLLEWAARDNDRNMLFAAALTIDL